MGSGSFHGNQTSTKSNLKSQMDRCCYTCAYTGRLYIHSVPRKRRHWSRRPHLCCRPAFRGGAEMRNLTRKCLPLGPELELPRLVQHEERRLGLGLAQQFHLRLVREVVREPPSNFTVLSANEPWLSPPLLLGAIPGSVFFGGRGCGSAGRTGGDVLISARPRINAACNALPYFPSCAVTSARCLLRNPATSALFFLELDRCLKEEPRKEGRNSDLPPRRL
jgi:hypothetical protein